MVQVVMTALTEQPPTCAFGNPSPIMPGYDGLDHCPACHAEVERGIAAFHAAVAAGTYDAEGYTPAERKAQEKKAHAAGRLF